MTAEPEFTLGIEEEYFLVDKTTRNVVGDPPYRFYFGMRVEPRLQVEHGPDHHRGLFGVVPVRLCRGDQDPGALADDRD